MVRLINFEKVDMNYPGINIKLELTVMQEYLKQLESGINSISESYIASEIEKNYKDAEYVEYQHLYYIGQDEFPRLIRLPLIVSIFTLFENSLRQLLSYAQVKESKKLKLNDLSEKPLYGAFIKYIHDVLEYDFEISQTTIQEISNLSKLRNCIAHTNGNLSEYTEKKIIELKAVKISGIPLDISNSQIDISYELLEKALQRVNTLLRELMLYMEQRYDFV